MAADVWQADTAPQQRKGEYGGRAKWAVAGLSSMSMSACPSDRLRRGHTAWNSPVSTLESEEPPLSVVDLQMNHTVRDKRFHFLRHCHNTSLSLSKARHAVTRSL